MINRQYNTNSGQGYYQSEYDDADYGYEESRPQERWRAASRRGNEGGAFQNAGGPAYYSQGGGGYPLPNRGPGAGGYGGNEFGGQGNYGGNYQDPLQAGNNPQWQRNYGGMSQGGYGNNPSGRGEFAPYGQQQYSGQNFGGQQYGNYGQASRGQFQSAQNRGYGGDGGYAQRNYSQNYGQANPMRYGQDPYAQHHSGAFNEDISSGNYGHNTPYGPGGWGAPHQAEYGGQSLGREFGSIGGEQIGRHAGRAAGSWGNGGQNQNYGDQSQWSRSGSGAGGQSTMYQMRHRKGPKGYTRSDERIKEDVCDCLMQSWAIDPEDIEVEVQNCVVTLNGTVHSRGEKFRAEESVASVLGVKDVTNNLRVEHARSGDDDDDAGRSQSRDHGSGDSSAAARSFTGSKQSTTSTSTGSGSGSSRSGRST